MNRTRRPPVSSEVDISTIVESLDNSTQADQVTTVPVRHEGRSRNIAVRRGAVAAGLVGLVLMVMWANRGEEAYDGPARVDESGLCLEGVIQASTELDSANAIAQKGMRMVGLNTEEVGDVNTAQTWIQFNGGSVEGGPLPDSVLTAGDTVYVGGMCTTEDGKLEFRPR